MNIKEYDRQFERVFTGNDLINRKCDINEVSVTGSEFKNLSEYIDTFKKMTIDFDLMIFDFLVKYYWMIKKFCYSGSNRKSMGHNGVRLDIAFGVFMRHYVGFNNRMIIQGGGWFSKIVGYMEELFPFFSEGNPFTDRYEYPFKHMNLSCLFLVYQMDDRMELLNIGESRGMGYTEFMDYITNYINCYNDEKGEDYYIFIFSNRVAPYIKKKGYGSK